MAQAADELVLARTPTVLTIRGSTTFLVRWLIPVLGAFQACHRNIEVRPRIRWIHRHAADVGILYGHGAWPGLDGDLLFQDEQFPVCKPDARATVRRRCAGWTTWRTIPCCI